ncbi:MAG TPA: AI-2E family transporter [Candidatus Saccharimonadales bacterium]|nr:AI-2E family transporter [Candidatus Saccharimonadales bacterium]
MNALTAPRWSPTLKRVVVAVLVVALVFVIYRAGDIVRPFLWAAILGYILLPVVRAFENRLTNHRGAAAAIVFIAVLLLIAGGVRFLAPLAVEQTQTFQRSLPTLIANAQNTLAETLDQMGAEDLVPIVFGPISTAPLEVSRNVATLAVPFIVGFSHFLLEFLVFLIATFFFLRDWPRLINWSKRLVPPASRHELLPLGAQVSILLSRYVRGQLLLVAIMSTATTIGLTLFGVPFSLLLGLLTGVLEVIPIIGPITAGAIACLVALGNPNPFGWSQLAYVGAIAIMYTVLRHAEDYFVIPLVIGRIVRLHPALVIFSLLAGGAIFGLLGVVLAVPVAATLRLVLIYVSAKLRDEDPFPRLEEELAQEGERPAPAPVRTLDPRPRS